MAVQSKDYYETLGVPRTATPAEIKRAFRKLARTHHPDTAKDKGNAAEKFQRINQAHDVLSDPQKRKLYDARGEHWQEEPNSPDGGNGFHQRASRGSPARSPFTAEGGGFSDFFAAHFAGGAAGNGAAGFGPDPPRGTPFPQRGADVEAELSVSLEEALSGPQRQVTLLRSAGPGVPARSDTYKVRIPPGVQEGQRIRLAGQGEPGHGGGAQGDLFLKVHLARHSHFTVQQSDLHYDLELAPWEAVLGVQVNVPTLDGPTLLKVPPGTSAGSLLRMRGLGLPGDGGKRGDILATVRILTPATITPEEKILWEQLAAGSSFKARA